MSAFKKFLPGKKKSKKSSTASMKSATSEPNIAEGGNEPGYRNVKEKDLPKLHKAAWLGDMSKLKQLVKKGDVNQMDKHHRTPLHYACVKGYSDIAQWLCANRANLGICDENGRTALMRAVECASEACIETLLNHGAETNVVDVNLTTPLHLAATHGSISIATLLLERDARVNAPDTDKITPLYVAASLGFPEFVEFLLKEYAQINELDVYGRSPLIAASMEGHLEVVKVLLRYGADSEVKDKEGWKAVDHAAMAGHNDLSRLLEERIEEQETPPLQPDNNSNLGSAIGSPFRSTSTQPVSSVYGGPAVNITADSEEDSMREESPKRMDFENSWADSDSELEVEPKRKGPSLSTALKRNESMQSTKSLSKIPVASSASRESLGPKGDASPSPTRAQPGTSTESKIPRMTSGIPQLTKASSKETVSSQQSAIPKLQSKIPTPKGSTSNLASPEHQAIKEKKPQSTGLDSKIPRMFAASAISKESLAQAGDIKKVVTSPDDKEASNGERRGSLGWENADVSEWDSDSEDVSESDVLAALSGSPMKKKVQEKGKKKEGSKDPFGLFEGISATDSSDSEAHDESKPVMKTKAESMQQPGIDKEELNETAEETKPQNKAMNAETSEWDSSSEEISAPKPVLANIGKKTERKMEGSSLQGKAKEEFDLDVDFDTSEATSEFSSPEQAKKLQKPMEIAPKIEEEKEESESEFSDFSLNEPKEESQVAKSEIRTKPTVEEKDEKVKRKKMSESQKAQLAALGIEMESSISSLSDHDEFGELELSLTKHDELFSAKSPRQQATSVEPKAATAETATTDASKPESKDENTRKTSKAQYDALGIDFSDESDSPLESESEWERSLKNKAAENKQAAAKRNETAAGLDNEDKDMNVDSKEQQNFEESRRGVLTSKRDSDFVSDESFSVDTDDQLEEIEEERLKLADEEAAKDDFANDFDDSDFSFSENSKEERREDDRQVEDDNEDIEFEDKAGSLQKETEKYKKEADRKVDLPDKEQSSAGQSDADEVNVQREVESDGEFELVDGSDEASLSMEMNNQQVMKNEGIPEEFSSESESEEGEFDHGFDDAIVPSRGAEAGKGYRANVSIDEQRTDVSKDKERMHFLQNMLKKDSTAGSVSKMNIERDDERKKTLEAMVRPMNITPVAQQNVESGIGGAEFELQDEDESDLIEEGFEKQMREKEMAAKLEEEKRKKDLQEEVERRKAAEEAIKRKRIEEEEKRLQEEVERRKAAEEAMERKRIEEEQKRLQEEVERRKAAEGAMERKRIEEEQKRLQEEQARRVLEEQERQRLKEEKRKADELERIRREKERELQLQREMEEQRLQEMEAEKETMRLEMEAKIKQHQEELKQREELFEAEMKKREDEERERRLQQLTERNREREKLEEEQRKHAEEERRRFEEGKKAWEQKKQLHDEKLRKGKEELEEAAKKRKEEEMKAAEAARRLKEQEEAWRIKQSNPRKSLDEEQKRRDLEELMEIDKFMRETEGNESKKVSAGEVQEEIRPMRQSNQFKAPQPQFEDSITPSRHANQFVEKELELEPLNPQPMSTGNNNQEAERKLSESKKMREEAELLLQAARDKTNALMSSGQRSGATSRNSPRLRPLALEDFSDYGSADVDDNNKANNPYPQLRDVPYDVIHTPGSDAVDIDRNGQQISYPAATSPFEDYEIDMGQNQEETPNRRPKSAPMLTRDEMEGAGSPYKTSTPLALYASLSRAGHFQDSKALMKMQDSLRETKREMERLKDKNSALEGTKREMETDMREMQRTVEIFSKSQTDVERMRLDMEMEMRDMRYHVEHEMEAKTAAEGLVAQLREQMKRAEEKLAAEAEARQTIELAYKTLEAEFKVRENLTSQLESDVNDLRFTLHHERESRINQEQLYTEQLQQHEALLEEAQKTSRQHAQTVSQLEVIDQNRKSAESTADQLKFDLATTKAEHTRVSAQLEELKSTYENEVSRLRNKLQDKADALVSSERKQFQAEMHVEAERSTAKAESMRLTSNLDNEIANRKRLQAEFDALKTQLEKQTKTKLLTDSEVNKFKEETLRDKSKRERELSAVKDELQRTTAKLETTERRCDDIESELQAANIALAEKSGQLINASRETEYKEDILSQMEERLRREKAELEKAMARLRSELRDEQGKSEMILNDLRQSNEARESLEKILANIKTSNIHLEEKLQSETLFRAQHERSSEEHKDLWNSEVKSRSKLGLQLIAMEKEIHRLKNELAEERRNTVQAEERKKSMESQLELYDKRSLQNQKESTALRNKLKQYQRRLKDFESGPKIYSEFERERDVMMNNTSNLRRQVDSLTDQLRQEQDNRSRAEVSSKKNEQELASLREREKALSYERERLERENQLLEDELDRLKDYYERNYVVKSSLDTYKKEIETKARLEINNKLHGVNIQLEEQAAAREAYDRVRNETESKSKKELEETITGLKNELSSVKSALQDGIIKKSTYETEASRIRELYQQEITEKHKLSNQVTKLNERFAASNARLSLEKSRNQQLMDLTSSFRISPGNNGNATFQPAEREDYLSRPGLRSMDLKSPIPLTMDAFATPLQRPNTSPRDYISSLRRNYLS